jgi:hypothetical protein
VAVLNVLIDRDTKQVWELADGRTLVIIDEHPLTGVGARMHTVLVDFLLGFRNRRMMRALAQVVRERNPR